MPNAQQRPPEACMLCGTLWLTGGGGAAEQIDEQQREGAPASADVTALQGTGTPSRLWRPSFFARGSLSQQPESDWVSIIIAAIMELYHRFDAAVLADPTD